MQLENGHAHDSQLPGPQDVLSDGEDEEAGPLRGDIEAGGPQQTGKTAAVPQAQQRRWGATYSTQLRILFVRQGFTAADGVSYLYGCCMDAVQYYTTKLPFCQASLHCCGTLHVVLPSSMGL